MADVKKPEPSTGATEDVMSVRRRKYGIMADCDLEVNGNVVRITIDNPLPDNDKVILETDKAKVIQSVSGPIAGFLLSLEKPKFFDGT